MANRAFQFHTATKGCFSTANNYGVRRCSSYVPYAVGVGCHEYQHHFMINSQPSCSATAATPIRSHLHYYHQSQSFREINLNTDLVHRRSFSGTTSDKNGNDIAAGRSDNIDRSKFTHEVKIEMPNLDDDIKGVIEKWYKKEGDIIKKDEVICDIRTELFTFGMLTDDDFDSIMGVIHVPEGSDPVEHGTVICTTFNEGRDGDEETKDNDDA